mgnify:FL=1
MLHNELSLSLRTFLCYFTDTLLFDSEPQEHTNLVISPKRSDDIIVELGVAPLTITTLLYHKIHNTAL